MNTIPAEFQITTLLHQDTYLVNGELKKWTGATSPVYSTIASTVNYAPTLLGSIPAMDENAAESYKQLSLPMTMVRACGPL